MPQEYCPVKRLKDAISEYEETKANEPDLTGCALGIISAELDALCLHNGYNPNKVRDRSKRVSHIAWTIDSGTLNKQKRACDYHRIPVKIIRRTVTNNGCTVIERGLVVTETTTMSDGVTYVEGELVPIENVNGPLVPLLVSDSNISLEYIIED